MDEGNLLNCGVDKLYEIKENLIELYRYKDKNDDLIIELKKIEKNIQSLEKTSADEVQSTVKKRRTEIEDAYDKQLDKIRGNIKKIKDKRDKSKNKKVSERIEEETASLREENQRLKLEKKKLLKQNKVPAFCNTNLYYALYYPRYFKDIIIILFVLLLTLLVIPCGIYFFVLPEEKIVYLVALYIATVLVFGGLYILVGSRTKDKHQDVIRQGKELRHSIIVNKRKIKSIKNGIKKDNDESLYGLEGFDEELTRLDKEVQDLTGQKNDALSVFENTTVPVITAEIRKQYDEKIASLKAECDRMKAETSEAEEKIKALTLKVASEYEPYIGKDLITLDNINSLINIIEAGNAYNISEAVQFFRKNMG